MADDKIMKLKEFGAGSSSIEWGYDLSLLVGHLEALVYEEQQNLKSFEGKKAKRLELAEDALDKLNQVLEM